MYNFAVIASLIFVVLMAFLDYRYSGGKKIEKRKVVRKRRKKRNLKNE